MGNSITYITKRQSQDWARPSGWAPLNGEGKEDVLVLYWPPQKVEAAGRLSSRLNVLSHLNYGKGCLRIPGFNFCSSEHT